MAEFPPPDDWYHGDDWDGEPEDNQGEDAFLRGILDELGIDSIDKILIDIEDADLSALRGVVFDDLQSAILYLYDLGVLDFSGIVEIDDGEYGVIIPDDSPGGTK